VRIPLPLLALRGRLAQEGGSYLLVFGDPEVPAEAACSCHIVHVLVPHRARARALLALLKEGEKEKREKVKK